MALVLQSGRVDQVDEDYPGMGCPWWAKRVVLSHGSKGDEDEIQICRAVRV
jgi:hypothetical protein